MTIMLHENLWAPWRMVYLRELERKAGEPASDAAGPTASASGGNFLHSAFEQPERDVDNLVVYRNDDGLIMLNRYPYANGHVLIAHGEARPTLLDYTASQRAALWSLVERGTELVERTLRPQGVNIGFNQGTAAGAGLPEHLHAHIVPRWSGDTNFMSVVGQVRVIPQALEAMAEQYRDAVLSFGW